ncbi:STAS domain-containing protein [Ruminococcaceae bacterium OttesenSCG-928-I18]|nr:STAS domain-containing protein [Ruminococcaceae bacterium OttesenSCG-928-I18]
MTIEKNTQADRVTLAITGRIDTTTSPELEKAVEALGDEVQSLVLDLAEVNYLSSAGLRTILAAHKQMKKRQGMTVANVQDPVMNIFNMTGFSDILHFESL